MRIVFDEGGNIDLFAYSLKAPFPEEYADELVRFVQKREKLKLIPWGDLSYRDSQLPKDLMDRVVAAVKHWKLVANFQAVKHDENDDGYVYMRLYPLRAQLTLNGPEVELTDAHIRAAEPCPDGTRCEHEYDCCGNFYAGSIEICRGPLSIVVIQYWSRNV